MERNWLKKKAPLVLIVILTTCNRSTIADARYITGEDGSEIREGFRSDSPKKLSAFVLKFTPKGKTREESNVENGEQPDEGVKKKKNKEISKSVASESRSSAEKLSELKVLQELGNVRVSNPLTPAGQHNFTEGSIALGKVGNKKAGRLRFRISSGAIFPSSKLPDVLLKSSSYNSSHDETPLAETDKDGGGKTAEKPDEMLKTGSDPHPEESHLATEEPDVVNNECASSASSTVKKATVLRIFKQIAQQFDTLQELFADDTCECGSSYNRSRTKLTLENISNCQGNFTRVRFIRRKVTEKEKKPKIRTMEQLVADDDY